MSLSGIILSPVVSEKSFRLAAAGQYTFRVDPRATAPTIATAIGRLYGVSVTAIRTASQRGKVTRYRGRAGQRSDTKKAIVTLQSGQRIAGFETEDRKSEVGSRKSDASQPKATTAAKPTRGNPTSDIRHLKSESKESK